VNHCRAEQNTRSQEWSPQADW